MLIILSHVQDPLFYSQLVDVYTCIFLYILFLFCVYVTFYLFDHPFMWTGMRVFVYAIAFVCVSLFERVYL